MTTILSVMLGISGLLALIGLVGSLILETRRARIRDARFQRFGTRRNSGAASDSNYWRSLRENVHDSDLDVETSDALRTWFAADPWIEVEFAEAFQANARLQNEHQREREAVRAVEGAAQRVNSLGSELEPGYRRYMHFPFAVAIIGLLVLLEVVPLNWDSLSFGLSTTATWIITGILIAASVGAMAAVKLTRENSWGRISLLILVAVAYVALVLLRSEFLVAVLRVSVFTAVLQAVLLNAIWVGLLVCGALVMARTRPLSLDRADRDLRRAQRRLAISRAARDRAERDIQRHWVVLQEMLRRWTLTSAIPAGVSQADRVNALERALLALFP